MTYETQTGPTDLRRLGFVAVYSESISVKAVSIADRLYQAVRVRAPLPSFVDDRLKIAEGKFTEFSTPAVSFIQDRATQILTIVDTKVWALFRLLETSSIALAGRKPMHLFI